MFTTDIIWRHKKWRHHLGKGPFFNDVSSRRGGGGLEASWPKDDSQMEGEGGGQGKADVSLMHLGIDEKHTKNTTNVLFYSYIGIFLLFFPYM